MVSCYFSIFLTFQPAISSSASSHIQHVPRYNYFLSSPLSSPPSLPLPYLSSHIPPPIHSSPLLSPPSCPLLLLLLSPLPSLSLSLSSFVHSLHDVTFIPMYASSAASSRLWNAHFVRMYLIPFACFPHVCSVILYTQPSHWLHM